MAMTMSDGSESFVIPASVYVPLGGRPAAHQMLQTRLQARSTLQFPSSYHQTLPPRWSFAA